MRDADVRGSEPPVERAFADALESGHDLLERLGLPVVPAGGRLSTVVLPARTFSLLVLGIPIPVFGSVGGNGQDLQRMVVERLNAIVRDELKNGHRAALHSFAQCFSGVDADRVVRWFPGFGHRVGSRRPPLLGIQLVTLHPFSNGQMEAWPEAPPEVVRCVVRIESILPGLFEELDRTLEEQIVILGPMAGSGAPERKERRAP